MEANKSMQRKKKRHLIREKSVDNISKTIFSGNILYNGSTAHTIANTNPIPKNFLSIFQTYLIEVFIVFNF